MAKCEPMEMRSLLPLRANLEEGTIFVDEIDSNGVITRGRHRAPGSTQDINLDSGKCKENENKFDCERPGFRYEGSVVALRNDRIVVVGTRSRRSGVKREKDGEEVNGDEVWVGVKTST